MCIRDRCVVTQQAICAECSTPYEGVNYSKDGLARHLATLKKQQPSARSGLGVAIALVLIAAPAFYASWQSVRLIGAGLIVQIEAKEVRRGDE